MDRTPQEWRDWHRQQAQQWAHSSEQYRKDAVEYEKIGRRELAQSASYNADYHSADAERHDAQADALAVCLRALELAVAELKDEWRRLPHDWMDKARAAIEQERVEGG